MGEWTGPIPEPVDQVWVLVSAALIFFMQAGFLALEAGLVRPKNAPMTALKSVVDWCVVSVLWLGFGFAFAFGDTAGGILGTSMWFGDGLDGADGGWIFFLFQMGFAGTAATIVSGAMAERVGFHTYVICTIVNGGLIYPVVAHWAWGNAFDPTQSSWLTEMKFHDFAGSTVVHTVGGSISIVSIWMLGPRLGRFDAEGKPRPMEILSLPLAAVGAFVLWFGWWGFNGGSTLKIGNSAAAIIVNTNIAGAVAALVAWLHGRWSVPDRDVEAKFLGGALAGLVAITAGCDIVTPGGAVVIGVLAGLVHNVVFELLLKLRLDDPVGAVPVHLGGGVLGTICAGAFAKSEYLDYVGKGRFEQIVVQLIGCGAAAAFSIVVTIALLAVLRKTLGLRASPREEHDGLVMCALPPEAEAPKLDEAALRKLMGGE